MTDLKISQLTDGSTVQTGDNIPVERSGSNYRVQVGSSATRSASDATKARVASVNGSTSAGHVAIFADALGTITDGGEPGAFITGATIISPVLTTDYVPLLRGGQIYLATVADLLDPEDPFAAGQFDFSDPDNSAFAALI